MHLGKGHLAVPGQWIPFPDGKRDFLDDACKLVLADHWEGAKKLPDDHEAKLNLGKVFVACCLAGNEPPKTKVITGPDLFSGEQVRKEYKPTLR